MGPYFNNVNFFNTNFFGNSRPLAMPATTTTNYMTFPAARNDRFASTNLLASFSKLDHSSTPYDAKTGTYPNFNSPKNLQNHMTSILFKNFRFAADNKKDFNEVMRVLCQETGTPQANRDAGRLNKALSVKYGFSDKDISKLWLLGGMKSISGVLNTLKKTNPDPESPTMQRIEGLGKMQSSLVKQYERIHRPPMPLD